MVEKAPDAFRTISEVAEWLDTPTYVLRFWESRFSQIKPVKRAGGRRYYRPEDMRLLGGIKRLLHFEEHTIKAVQAMLKEKGLQHVTDLSPSLDEPVKSPNRGDAETTRAIDAMVAEAKAQSDKPRARAVGVKVIKKGQVKDAADDAPVSKDQSAAPPPKQEPPVPEPTAQTTEATEALEDWEREDPDVVESVPYRVAAAHAYTQAQLDQIETLYSELSAIRDRLNAA